MSSADMTSTRQIIALINTNGVERTERLSLSAQEPINVGRGWQNSLIINDPYTDSLHLSIKLDESGSLSVRDLNTKNGSRINKVKIDGEHRYEEGSIIQVGESQLRFYDAEKAVAPTLPLDTAHLVTRKYNSTSFILLLTAAALAALFGFLYFFNTEEFNPDTIFSNVTGFGILAVVWVLIAAFVGKLFRRETNIGMHWMLLCLLAIVVTLLRFPIDVLKFNIDSSTASSFIDKGFIAIATGIFIFATLSLATRLSAKKRWVASLFLAIIPQLVIWASPLLKEERDLWDYQADSQRITQPPALLLRSANDLDQHMNRLDDLFNEVDEQVGDKN